MNWEVNLKSTRARRARLSAKFGKSTAIFLAWISILAIVSGSVLLYASQVGYIFIALGLACAMPYFWYHWDLKDIPPIVPAKSLDDILEQDFLASLGKKEPENMSLLWQVATKPWQAAFVLSHLLLYRDSLSSLFSESDNNVRNIWQTADQIRQKAGANSIDAGAVATTMLLSSRATKDYLAKNKLQPDDIYETYDWLSRLSKYIDEKRPYFGGIGRDWAAGFTPMLDRFGENISREVEVGNGHFHTLAHADILDGAVNSLTKQRGLAIVGDTGVGKTSVVYALAERLLKGKDVNLQYYQIFKLNSSQIISAAGDQLESVMLAIFGEAVHAHNIIVFLDEAELFFGEGTGAFDAGQILLPVLENRSLKVVTTWTPDDFQSLKTKNSSLAGQFDVINVSSPDAPTTMRILEDTALTFEARDKVLVSYESIKESCRLADQYLQNQSFPGKAINLLEQALPYAQQKIVSAESVQIAVEKTRGIKVAKASGPETDVLLNLEDKIHGRMINQERAVKVIAAALRRGRAGVSDPKRPIGSFLFLGPTGVGKTELARSLAAVYFGDERQMTRLDMSEYQQTEDIDRLLDPGGEADRSLILKIREQPFAVILLDEIEKAHPNILNLLLQMLDEGQLTDKGGKPASFRNAIIIATSNAGSAEITQRVAHGDKLDNFERPLVDSLIKQGLFKAELINRFDEIVLFRPLSMAELSQVANLMLVSVNKILAKQNVSVKLTQNALAKVVQAGYDPQFGARPMRRVIQKMVEDAVATKILKNEAQPGTTLTLDVADLAERS